MKTKQHRRLMLKKKNLDIKVFLSSLLKYIEQ